MGLPMMKITPQIAATRIRENKLDALDRALSDLFMDLEHEVSMPMLLDAIQASLTARMGLIDDCSFEHSTQAEWDLTVTCLSFLTIKRSAYVAVGGSNRQ